MEQSFFVKTYGCQMNQYDSEKIGELLVHNGFKKAKHLETSDVAILNTCHIREKASEKFYSDLGRLSVFKKNKENQVLTRQRKLKRAVGSDQEAAKIHCMFSLN